MAKTSAIQRNLKRIRMVKKFSNKREKLKKIIKDKKINKCFFVKNRLINILIQ